MAESEERKTDELLLSFIKFILDRELQQFDSFDNKALGFVGALTFVAGLTLGISSLDVSAFGRAFYLPFIFFGGIISLLIAMILALGTIRIKRMRLAPDFAHLSEIIEQPYDIVLRKNVIEWANAVSYLEAANTRKALTLQLSTYFLIIGLTLVFIFIAVYIYMSI